MSSTARPLEFQETALLRANPNYPSGLFGSAMAREGDWMLVGAPGYASEQGGSAHAFKRDAAGAWQHVQRLAGRGTSSYDDFGLSVDLDGSTVFVGAPTERQDFKQTPGVVYAYDLSNDRWTERQRLEPSEGVVDDNFGSAVALKADVAAIGAPARLSDDGGKAYIFERDSSGDWQETQILTRQGPSHFGEAIAFDGETLAISDSIDDDYFGSVTIYTKSMDSWVEQQRVVPNDPSKISGFGVSIHLRADILLVGADLKRVNNVTTGAVYVFTRDANGTWNQTQRLSPSSPENGEFGESVSMSADWLVVGAPYGTVNINEAGAAYAFQLGTNGAWVEVQKFVSPKTAAHGTFGDTVLLSEDNQLVVSDPKFKSSHGAAIVFELGEPPATGGGGPGGAAGTSAGGQGSGGGSSGSGGQAGTGDGGAAVGGAGGTPNGSGGAPPVGGSGGARTPGGAAGAANAASGEESDSGCGCSTVGRPSTGSSAFFLAGLLIPVLRRRSRRRHVTAAFGSARQRDRAT